MSILGERSVDPGLSRNRPHGNVGILRIAVLVLFGILGIRLVQMQLVNGAEFAQRSEDNRVVVQKVLPSRGLVYDRNGVPLVENGGVFVAVVTPAFLPSDVGDRYRMYLYLETMLGVPALQIQEAVSEAEAEGLGAGSITIARNLARETALILEQAAADLPGVTLEMEPGRRYVGGPEFSHVLGYVGPQSPNEWRQLQHEGYAFNEVVGKVGVEGRYETKLRGRPGAATVEVDAQGELITTINVEEPIPGQSLRLTLDADLQRFVFGLLDATMEEARVAAAVVMSPITGEVYALVSLPTYDNNIFSGPELGEEFAKLLDDPRKPLLNQALGPAAPGSTFKMITAAAALEEGTIPPETRRNIDSLVLEFVGENKETYFFYDWRVHGELDLIGAIAWSSNIYFYMASCGVPQENIQGLGKDIEQSAVTLGYYARSFGLGKVTGIDLVSSEAAGLVPNPEWKRRVRSGPLFNPEDREWYLADTCFMGIGQGDVTATPLQIATATAAVANGGFLLKPHVAKQLISNTGEVVGVIEPSWDRVPVGEEHLDIIRQGMYQSVLNGAASNAAIPGFEVAGKTGTAEFTDPVDGLVKQHAWFTGFAPYSNPEVVVTVYYDLGIGGRKAAPVAGRIIEYFMENVSQ